MKQLMKHKKRVEKERLQADPEDYKELDLVVCSQNGTPTNRVISEGLLIIQFRKQV